MNNRHVPRPVEKILANMSPHSRKHLILPYGREDNLVDYQNLVTMVRSDLGNERIQSAKNTTPEKAYTMVITATPTSHHTSTTHHPNSPLHIRRNHPRPIHRAVLVPERLTYRGLGLDAGLARPACPELAQQQNLHIEIDILVCSRNSAVAMVLSPALLLLLLLPSIANKVRLVIFILIQRLLVQTDPAAQEPFPRRARGFRLREHPIPLTRVLAPEGRRERYVGLLCHAHPMVREALPLAYGTESHEVLSQHGGDENAVFFVDNLVGGATFGLDEQGGISIFSMSISVLSAIRGARDENYAR